LNEEDLGTIEALFEAGTPVRVLLSKADILSPADRQSARDYKRSQATRRLSRSSLACDSLAMLSQTRTGLCLLRGTLSTRYLRLRKPSASAERRDVVRS